MQAFISERRNAPVESAGIHMSYQTLVMPTSHERRNAFIRGVGWTNHDALIGGHGRAQSQIFHQPARKFRERSSRGYALYVDFGPPCRTLGQKELQQDSPVLDRCNQAGNSGGGVETCRWCEQSTKRKRGSRETKLLLTYSVHSHHLE